MFISRNFLFKHLNCAPAVGFRSGDDDEPNCRKRPLGNEMRRKSSLRLCASGILLHNPSMSPSPSPPAANRSRLMETLCEKLPNCTRAISLAETGAERPLKTGERLALRYHSRLCPFCGCAQGKFDIAMEQMRAAEAERSRSS